ncbi:barstar family protein [Streptomyces litchfieldiae]|uniref:Barstar family protein n=1 Tax=Streptomyces litchfieldiae TaxID=3075543 RepID=A0ABU2MPG6_9ACTN|nr:barstar family protein [Streptomyces sp. DSM 44938]MDT0343521.1 barstar family protein [Streptomyces sp. DSM 44938]
MPDLPFHDARDLSAPHPHRLDLELLRNGHVTRFSTRKALDAAVAGLQHLGYRVHVIDAARWHDQRAMHRDLAGALRFPDYYGHNLDALNDMFRDIAAFRSHGTDLSATGTALALPGFGLFHAREERTAHALLDMFAAQARAALLGLHPMLCLVGSDRPLAPVGTTEVEAR